jgi:ABC-type glycerol-3-phosphate transport system substrate-binding protein
MLRNVHRQVRRAARQRRIGGAAVALAIIATLTACSGTSATQGPTTITVWQNGSMGSAFGWMRQAATDFEKIHPGVTIKYVEKPQDNFFAVLKTAFISGNGPDIAQVYPGTYLTPVKSNLLDLKKYIPTSVLSKLPGVQYYADGKSAPTLGLAPEDQFYNMWYNKALFAKAGIETPPTTFAQMKTACTALRAVGVTPYADGTPTFVTPGAGATQDWTYLASALPLSQWNKILDGKAPYNSPTLVKQVADWASLYPDSCTSTNVTTENGDALFAAGKVAMMMNYSGYYGDYIGKLGTNLGSMVPPWSVTPQKTLAEYPGTGFSVNKASPNAKLAAEFLQYIVSTPAQRLVAKSGNIPILPSVPAQGAALQNLQTMARSGKYKLYPFFDNYMPSQVVAQINTTLPQAFVGSQSAKSALDAFQSAYESIPGDQRGGGFNLGG